MWGDSTTSYKFTHIIAIDFGTSGCGIAVFDVYWSKVNETENIRLINWFRRSIGICKCPTILLLDHEENVEAFGFDAIDKYHSKRVAHSNKINDYRIARNFGGVKLWRIFSQYILASKTLANSFVLTISI